MRELRPVEARGVGQVDKVAVAAAHNEDMATSKFVGWEADNHRSAAVSSVNHLLQSTIIAPVRLKAKLRTGALNPCIMEQTKLRCNLVKPGFDFENIGDAIGVAIRIDHFGHRSSRAGRVRPGIKFLHGPILAWIELAKTNEMLRGGIDWRIVGRRWRRWRTRLAKGNGRPEQRMRESRTKQIKAQ